MSLRTQYIVPSNLKLAVKVRNSDCVTYGYDIFNLTNTKVVHINSLEQVKAYYGDNSIVVNIRSSLPLYDNTLASSLSTIVIYNNNHYRLINGLAYSRESLDVSDNEYVHITHVGRHAQLIEKLRYRIRDIVKLYTRIHATTHAPLYRGSSTFDDTLQGVTINTPIWGINESDDARAFREERLVPRVPQDYTRWLERRETRARLSATSVNSLYPDIHTRWTEFDTTPTNNNNGNNTNNSTSNMRSVSYLLRSYHDSSEHNNIHFLRNDDEEARSTTRYFGIELETEMRSGSEQVYLNALNNFINNGDYNKRCKFERDGSLNNGCEIISQPMTMNYIQKYKDKIKEVLRIIDDNGATSHDNNHCGLHVHVSRTSLTEDALDNLYLLFEFFRKEITIFSRRTSFQYCAFMNLENNRGIHLYDKEYFKHQKSMGHGCALNNGNSRTIEFRIFRGTTNFRTFMASIELVDNLCEIAKYMPNTLTWDDIINYNNNYTELKEYNSAKNISSNRVFNGILDTYNRGL